MRLGELGGLRHHAHAALRRWRQHHLGTEEPHEPAALHAEGLGHGDHQRITFLGAHHREADAGIAARSFDNRLPGFRSPDFSALDDAKRQAILNRAQRIKRLDLDEKITSGGASLFILRQECFQSFRGYFETCLPCFRSCRYGRSKPQSSMTTDTDQKHTGPPARKKAADATELKIERTSCERIATDPSPILDCASLAPGSLRRWHRRSDRSMRTHQRSPSWLIS